eukprot:4958714-Prymnesium_polylepis.1
MIEQHSHIEERTLRRVHVPHTTDDAAITTSALSQLPRFGFVNVFVALDKIWVLGRPQTRPMPCVESLSRRIVALDFVEPSCERSLRCTGVYDFTL